MAQFTAFNNYESKAIAGAMRPSSADVHSINATTADIVDTTETTLFNEPGAGYFNFITFLVIVNSDPVQGVWVNIKDESGNVLFSVFAAANGGGAILPLANTPVRSEVANKKITVVLEGPANVRVSAAGYIAT
jgi:hypothetical protein